MKISCAALVLVAGILGAASCSEKSKPDRERDANSSDSPRGAARESQIAKAKGEAELQPSEDQIEEDCAAFVRSTKVVPAPAASTSCPACPPGGTEVLSFGRMKTDAITCTGDTCSVLVTVRAVFNPGSGETIVGGLTAWIPPEQRSAYVTGRTPAGEQTYRVQIAYKRQAEGWRAVEFDRGPVQ